MLLLSTAAGCAGERLDQNRRPQAAAVVLFGGAELRLPILIAVR
jgi:hypothetical protein